MTQSQKVYTAISNVTGALAKEGISKDNKNTQQGYSFRGIDDVYNALAGLLAEHKLVIMPRVLSREVVERTTKSGTALFYVLLDVEYDFISCEDGSKYTVKVYGEAMDSGDKATNKAMSAAYKYACLQTFCIPTEGDNDADKTTHEVTTGQPSPFKTATARNTFCKNVTDSFKDAKTEKELKTLAELNKDMLDKMKASGAEHDQLAVEELQKQYKLAADALKQTPDIGKMAEEFGIDDEWRA